MYFLTAVCRILLCFAVFDRSIRKYKAEFFEFGRIIVRRHVSQTPNQPRLHPRPDQLPEFAVTLAGDLPAAAGQPGRGGTLLQSLPTHRETLHPQVPPQYPLLYAVTSTLSEEQFGFYSDKLQRQQI